MKKSNVFSHYILTRFNFGLYDRDDADEWMKDRMKLFAATKDSVLSQKGIFEWIISVDERTPEKYLKKIFTDDRMIKTHLDLRQVFLQGEVCTIKDWVITTRLDNDDILLEGAIKAIQDHFKPEIRVIDIDYHQYKDGVRYTSERFTTTSPFLSLIEPSSRVMTALCRPHSKLVTGYPSPTGLKAIRGKKIMGIYALMVLHGNNAANQLVGQKV
jgi:hypothetical protein